METRLILVGVATGVIWSLFAYSQLVIRPAAADIVLAPLISAVVSYECVATTPDTHDGSRNPENGNFRSDGTFGNDSLSTILGSHIIFRPGSGGMEYADGSLSMKYMWWRLEKGQLTIEGRRLDAAAPPLRARIPQGYGDIGFQATGLIFPTTGCWEVTGRVGDGSLTFVVLVEKIGDGPCWKEVRPPGEVGSRVATTAWTEEPFAESTGGLNLIHASGEREYVGGKLGISGTSKFHFLLTRDPDESATFVGYEKITGSVNGNTGTFAIQHTGNVESGIARSTWVILNSSGTGELTQIAGHGAYSSGLDDKACYSITPSGI